MTELGVDYAWVHPDPKAIAVAGYTTVLRYLSTDASKNLSATEARSLHANGLSIALVWETSAQAALNGPVVGNADAAAAVAQARALGYGKGATIFANVGDFAATAGQMPYIGGYYSAFASVISSAGFTPGGYGTSFIIDNLVIDGFRGIWWQNAMNDSGDSGSIVSPNASLYQRVTPTKTILGAAGEYDEDVIIKPFPVWGPVIIPNPPPPPPQGVCMVTLPVLNVGSMGYPVRSLQILLNAYDNAKLGVDGNFGPLTSNAVKAFQAARGLGADGIVGTHTWGSLLGTPQ